MARFELIRDVVFKNGDGSTSKVDVIVDLYEGETAVNMVVLCVITNTTEDGRVSVHVAFGSGIDWGLQLDSGTGQVKNGGGKVIESP